MSNTNALIKTIEAALVDGSSETARQTAARACRQLLSALEAKPGEQLASVVPLHGDAPPVSSPTPSPPSVNPTLLLDALIVRLQSELPKTDQVEAGRPELRIPFVPIPAPKSSSGQ